MHEHVPEKPDFATPLLQEQKKKYGIAHRTDIMTIPELIDLDEERRD